MQGTVITDGGLDQVVEHALRMREVAGSMPAFSTNIHVMLYTWLSCVFLLAMAEKH